MKPSDVHWHIFQSYVYNDFNINNANTKIKYFKLPLCDNCGNYLDKSFNESNTIVFKQMPKLRISNIYFTNSCPIESNLFSEFANELKYYAEVKLCCSLPDLKGNQINIP